MCEIKIYNSKISLNCRCFPTLYAFPSLSVQNLHLYSWIWMCIKSSLTGLIHPFSTSHSLVCVSLLLIKVILIYYIYISSALLWASVKKIFFLISRERNYVTTFLLPAIMLRNFFRQTWNKHGKVVENEEKFFFYRSEKKMRKLCKKIFLPEKRSLRL